MGNTRIDVTGLAMSGASCQSCGGASSGASGGSHSGACCGAKCWSCSQFCSWAREIGPTGLCTIESVQIIWGTV